MSDIADRSEFCAIEDKAMKSCPVCSAEFPDGARTCPEHGVILLERLELEPGQMFREMKIVKVLGRGGMGVVYLAEHVLLKQPRALKFLGAESAMHNPQAVQRFLREAQRASELGLHNVNIVKTLDMGQDEKFGFFICMEYVYGPSLAALLAAAPQGLPVDRALRIVRGIASGLDTAHSMKMVHRDIKPANVLLGVDAHGEEIAKIADFGIVTGGEEENRLTRTGIGQPLTPHYASPEQWRGVIPGHALDGRTDLYALGCMFFEMLTGSVPFRGESVDELREQHLHAAPPAPSLLRPELRRWPGLDGVVLRMMAKAREHRQADVKAFLAELDAAVGSGARLIGREEWETRREATVVESAGAAKREPVLVGADAGRAGKGSLLRRWPAAVPWVLAGIGLSLLGWAIWELSKPEAGLLPSINEWTRNVLISVFCVSWAGAWLIVRPTKEKGKHFNRLAATLFALGFVALIIHGGIVLLGSTGIGTYPYLKLFTDHLKLPLPFGFYGFLTCGYGVWLVARRIGSTRFQPSGGMFALKAVAIFLVWDFAGVVVSPLWAKCFWLGIVFELLAQSVWGWFSAAAALWLMTRSLGIGVEDGGQSAAVRTMLRRRGKFAVWVVVGLTVAGFSGQAVYRIWKVGDLRQSFDTARSKCDAGDLAACKEQSELNNSLKYTYNAGGAMSDEELQRLTFRTNQLACDGGDTVSCLSEAYDYKEGTGVALSYENALASYTKACDGGNKDGCWEAGMYWQLGHPGMAPDVGKAQPFYKKGCALGDKRQCVN